MSNWALKSDWVGDGIQQIRGPYNMCTTSMRPHRRASVWASDSPGGQLCQAGLAGGGEGFWLCHAFGSPGRSDSMVAMASCEVRTLCD